MQAMFPGHLAVVMGVDIDEAGRDDPVLRVDLPVGADRQFGADGNDQTVRNGDIGDIRLTAGTYSPK